MMTSTSMPMTYLPTTKEIKDLFEGLLGREITLTPTAPLVPSATAPRSAAVYYDDHQGVRAIIACDLEFSARAAAALALMPAHVAEAAIEQAGLDETMGENLYEVLNVAAALFNVGGAVHLRLVDLHPAGTVIPGPVVGRMLTLGRREDLEIDIAGYGAGRFSIVICA